MNIQIYSLRQLHSTALTVLKKVLNESANKEHCKDTTNKNEINFRCQREKLQHADLTKNP